MFFFIINISLISPWCKSPAFQTLLIWNMIQSLIIFADQFWTHSSPYPSYTRSLELSWVLTNSQTFSSVLRWDSWPAHSALSNTIQDVTGSICGKGTLLTHLLLVHSAVFQFLVPPACTDAWVSSSLFVVLFIKLHEILFCPFLWPVQVSLNFSTSIFHGLVPNWTRSAVLVEWLGWV